MASDHSHSEYDLLGGTSWDLLWVDPGSSAAEKILEQKISPEEDRGGCAALGPG